MRLNDLIKDASSIPSIPKIAQELMEDFANDEIRLMDVSKKLRLDQALSAKVLRMANSAKYARSRTFDSVDEASIVVGLGSLKTLVLASGVASAFKGGVNMHELWRRSFMLAEACRYLALESDENPETGFTVGLLHNLGEILIATQKPEMYKHFLNDTDDFETKSKKEERIYGLSSIAAGSELATRWKFPPTVTNAIAEQASVDAGKHENHWVNLLHLGLGLVDAHDANTAVEDLPEDVSVVAKKEGIDLASALEAMNQCAEDTKEYLVLIQ